MSKKSSSGSRGFLPLLLILSATLVVLFHQSFATGKALFSNDGPLGIQFSRPYAMPEGFLGIWNDLNWLGSYNGALTPNFTGMWFALGGPMGRVNWYAPISSLVVGLCAWIFFRRLGGSPRVAILASIAAALNSNFFSNACWGLASREFCLAAVFLALAAIEIGMLVQPILASILAGLAIGLSISEGGDNGAIFSMFVAAYAFWRTLVTSTSKPKGAAWGVGKVAIMAVFAAVMASQTLDIFVRTSVKGIVGVSQDQESKQARWNFATQWSLPKIETLRVIIPGIFGYRMDTPNGGNYWGRVGESPEAPQQLPRYSGAGEYAGVLVVLIAIWAIVEALRKKGQVFTVAERKLIWFWAVMGFIAMLLGWGRHAPFYKLVYMLPYFSTIRNPMKFFHVVHLCIMVLFAYGLIGLSRRYLDVPAKAASLFGQLKAWWSKGPTHERLWTWACIAALALGAVAWLGLLGSRSELVKHLMASGFSDQDVATQIAKFSAMEVLLFVVFLAASIAVVTLILSGAFSGPRARWAAALLGLVLIVDLARANKPWIIYYDWHSKYDVAAEGKTIDQRRTSNPVIALLRENPAGHRVTMPGFQLSREFGFLQQVYHVEWLQHQFPFYGVQSIDIPQEPRVPEDKQAYREALSRNMARLWQLTNTRYIFGMAGNFAEALNQQIDPAQKRFRVASTFNLFQKPGTQYIGAETNATGPFALIEFTGALPRAKLFSNWEIIPEGTNVLARLADPSWDPAHTVLISDAAAPKPAGTNAPGGTAEIIDNPTTKLMRVRTQSTAPGMLLLNDKIEPEWHAYIDNKEVPIYRANFLARGVHVPSGQHEVTFKFQMQPTGFKVVAACEVLGVVLLAIVIWSAKRKRASAEPVPAAPTR
jgi:hypothetical protein